MKLAHMFDQTTTLPESACCECGHIMDHASGEGTPEPGDFTLCIRCASLNVFADDLSLRAPADAEFFAAAADSDIQQLRRIILSVPAKLDAASPQREGDRPVSPNDGREREPNV